MVPSFHEVPLTSSLPIRRGTPLPFVYSAPKYRRRRARSQRSSHLISFPTGFLLKKQRAGTRERTFFRPGPLTRGSWSARKSAIIEAEKWRGDLRSLGRTQITEKGVYPLGDTPDSFSIPEECPFVSRARLCLWADDANAADAHRANTTGAGRT